jgi:AraC-like DNA-binding protein/quercetin dioxygenase-like cupin family protein
MSKSRQSRSVHRAVPRRDRLGASVRSLALRLQRGHEFDEHAHAWGQIVFAERGVLAVDAGSMRWVVPPQRCLWMPPGAMHRLRCLGDVHMRTVYVAPQPAKRLGAAPQVLEVAPFLRELLLEISRIGTLDDSDATHRALAHILLATIGRAASLGLALPLPSDPRALEVAQRVFDSIETSVGTRRAPSPTLARLARGAGLSARTAERLFAAETGMSFGRWRQQARLQFAVRRLAEGASVRDVARACGYGSASAFVAMFRLALGTTPGRYCAARDDSPRGR